MRGRFYKAWDGWLVCVPCADKLIAEGKSLNGPKDGELEDTSKCVACGGPAIVPIPTPV